MTEWHHSDSEHTSEVWKQQKNLVRTVLQGSPKIWGLTTGLLVAAASCSERYIALYQGCGQTAALSFPKNEIFVFYFYCKV